MSQPEKNGENETGSSVDPVRSDGTDLTILPNNAPNNDDNNENIVEGPDDMGSGDEGDETKESAEEGEEDGDDTENSDGEIEHASNYIVISRDGSLSRGGGIIDFMDSVMPQILSEQFYRPGRTFQVQVQVRRVDIKNETEPLEEVLNRCTTEENYKKRRRSCENCTICRDELVEEQTIRRLLCLHTFHKDCIDLWFKEKRECPLCKNQIHRNPKQSN